MSRTMVRVLEEIGSRFGAGADYVTVNNPDSSYCRGVDYSGDIAYPTAKALERRGYLRLTLMSSHSHGGCPLWYVVYKDDFFYTCPLKLLAEQAE